MRTKIFGGLLAVSVVSLSALSADAADFYYSGLQCVRLAGSGGFLEYYGGTVMNSSSSSELTVACSLPAIPQTVFVPGSLSVRIRAFDRNPSTSPALNVRCNIAVETGSTTNGLITTSSGVLSTSGAGPNAQELPFNSVDIGDDAYAYMVCTIPRSSNGANSHIANIEITKS